MSRESEDTAEDTDPLLEDERGLSLRFWDDRQETGTTPITEELSTLPNGVFGPWKTRKHSDHVIEPLFGDIQRAPLQILDKYAPTRLKKVAVLVAAIFVWISILT